MNDRDASRSSAGIVTLADEDAVKRVITNALFGLWSTVNDLSRLRPSTHDRYRVTVFGSARTDPNHSETWRSVSRVLRALKARSASSGSLSGSPGCRMPCVL